MVFKDTVQKIMIIGGQSIKTQRRNIINCTLTITPHFLHRPNKISVSILLVIEMYNTIKTKAEYRA